mgnify:CR=1 FL=1
MSPSMVSSILPSWPLHPTGVSSAVTVNGFTPFTMNSTGPVEQPLVLSYTFKMYVPGARFRIILVLLVYPFGPVHSMIRFPSNILSSFIIASVMSINLSEASQASKSEFSSCKTMASSISMGGIIAIDPPSMSSESQEPPVS